MDKRWRRRSYNNNTRVIGIQNELRVEKDEKLSSIDHCSTTQLSNLEQQTKQDYVSKWRRLRYQTSKVRQTLFNPEKNCFSIMGRNLTLTDTKTTFTRTHLQGETTQCWLYSITSSLHQSMKLKAGKVLKLLIILIALTKFNYLYFQFTYNYNWQVYDS